MPKLFRRNANAALDVGPLVLIESVHFFQFPVQLEEEALKLLKEPKKACDYP
jgi:hypothetical protein